MGQSDTGWIALRMPVCSERTAVLFECLQAWNQERETGVDERDLQGSVEREAPRERNAYSGGKSYKVRDNRMEDYCRLKSYHLGVGLPGPWVKIYDTKCPKAAAHSLLENAYSAAFMA